MPIDAGMWKEVEPSREVKGWVRQGSCCRWGGKESRDQCCEQVRKFCLQEQHWPCGLKTEVPVNGGSESMELHRRHY